MAAYGTNAEAITFFTSWITVKKFLTASDARQTAARTQATAIIDQFNYIGQTLAEGQTNQFPRNNDANVPTAIEEACYLIADALLDGIDPEMELEILG